MGVFSDYASLYYENGFNVLPLNGKKPFFEDWSVWCTQRIPEDMFSEWIRLYGSYNIGIPLGSYNKLVAVDIDTMDEEFNDALMALIPRSPYVKKGRKGPTSLYLHTGQISTSMKTTCKKYGIDLLSTGRQTALPPSIHPDTFENYIWLPTQSDMLIDIKKEDLVCPEIDFDKVLYLFTMLLDNEKFVNRHEGLDKNKSFTGRNDYLVSVVHAMFHQGKTPHEIVEEILLVDKKKHKLPLFEDTKEFKSTLNNPTDRALEFALNNYKTFARFVSNDKNKNHPALSIDNKYPSKKNGFYKDMKNNKGETYEGIDLPCLSEFCKEELGLKVTDAYKLIWDGKKYKFIGDYAFLNKVYELTNKRLATKHTDIDKAKKVINMVCGSDDDLSASAGFINLSNGVFNIKTGELLPHNKKYGFKYVLPYDYNESSKCPIWISAIEDIFEGDIERINIVQEFFGDVLRSGFPRFHKALGNFGSGSNGKSITSLTLCNLVGKENYSTIDITELDKDGPRAQLFGKLVNISGETAKKTIQSNYFKSIVSGDPITAKFLYQDQFSFVPTTRLWFNLNNEIKFDESNSAINRRLIVLPYNKSYGLPGGSPQDVSLLSKIEPELSGIFNWALIGLKRLEENKRFSASEAEKDLTHEMRLNTCSAYSYFNEVMDFYDPSEVLFRDKNSCPLISDHYDKYLDYCAMHNFTPKQKNNFSRLIVSYVVSKFGEHQILKDNSLGNRARCYLLKENCKINIPIRVKNTYNRWENARKNV